MLFFDLFNSVSVLFSQIGLHLRHVFIVFMVVSHQAEICQCFLVLHLECLALPTLNHQLQIFIINCLVQVFNCLFETIDTLFKTASVVKVVGGL